MDAAHGPERSDALVGIAWKVASTFVFTVMIVLVKVVADRIPVGELMFARNFFGLLPVLVFIAWRRELLTVMRTKSIRGHAKRGVVGMTAMTLWFLAIAHLSLPEATAIVYAAPLMMVVCAAVILHETVRLYRWTAVAIGFGGVVVILLPQIRSGFDVSSDAKALGAALALGSAMFMAFASTYVRQLAVSEPISTIVVYFLLTGTVLTALTAPTWVVPTTGDLVILVLIGVLGGIGQLLLTQAYHHAEASVIAPFEYVSMIWVTAFGYFVFAEVPTANVVVGAAIVVASGVFVLLRERQLARRGRMRGPHGAGRGVLMANWLAAPLWPLSIFTDTKAFTNPILKSERLNRRGLYAFRVVLAHRLAARRRRRLARLVTADEKRQFDATGAIVTTPLAAHDLAALRTEVAALRAPAYEMREGDAVTRRIALTPELLERLPVLAGLLASRAYQGPVRYAGSFDVAPQVYVQTIITHVASTGTADPQNDLHMDTFHPTVKAWLWLDDVSDEMGPFAYVKGSHRLTRRRLAWHKRRSVLAATGGPTGGSFRVSDAERVRMGLPEPHRFAVPGGTFVVGDTFGLHRRSRASVPTRRVEIWASSRPNPFYPFVRNWFWPLPGLAGREAALWQKLATFAHRHGLRERKDWYPVGEVGPWDEARHPSLAADAPHERKAAA